MVNREHSADGAIRGNGCQRPTRNGSNRPPQRKVLAQRAVGILVEPPLGPGKDRLRIKTTIRDLLGSVYSSHSKLSDVNFCIGKVDYLSDARLMAIAHTTYDDNGISVESIFRSLLVKRNAFKHEKEVRLLYDEWDDDFSKPLYRYDVDPHTLIKQIMIDPRKPHAEFKVLKQIIRKVTGFKGEIKRSLLYTLPKDIILDVTDILNEKNGT